MKPAHETHRKTWIEPKLVKELFKYEERIIFLFFVIYFFYFEIYSMHLSSTYNKSRTVITNPFLTEKQAINLISGQFVH